MAYKNVSIGIHSSFLTHFVPLQHWKLETKVYVSTYISAYINIYLLYVRTYRTIFCSNAEEHTVCYCVIAWLCSYVRNFTRQFSWNDQTMIEVKQLQTPLWEMQLASDSGNTT